MELASTRAELETMRQTHADTINRLAALPGALEKQYLVIERDQEIALIRLRELSEKLMQADISRIAAKTAPSSLKIVDYASPPDKPTWPNVKLLSLVAVLLGLCRWHGPRAAGRDPQQPRDSLKSRATSRSAGVRDH